MTPSRVASVGFLFALLFAIPLSLGAAEPLIEKDHSFRGLDTDAVKAKLAGGELREEEWKEGGFGGRRLAATFAGYEVLVFFSGDEAITTSFQVLSE